jgi:hypothetical protein
MSAEQSTPTDKARRVARGQRYIARCSYGNDSIAMLQLMREHGLKDVTVAYSDTGWSVPEWEDRVAKAEAWVRSLGWDHVRIPSRGFEAETMAQTEAGMFPTRQRKWCTKYLKIKPFLRWVADFDPEKRALVCVGVRRAESDARKYAPAFLPEQDNGRHVWHPIVEFDDAARDAMILKTPLPVLDHRSWECFCINWGRKEIRQATEEHIARVETLEAKVGRPMFNPAGKMGATGIREVRRWAEAERGKYRPPDHKPDTSVIDEAIEDADGATCADGWCGS